MSQRATVYLIDGHYFIFRAYHALPDLRSPRGDPVGAVYGFAQTLIKLATDLRPCYLATAFDVDPIHSFRSAIFPKYKCARGEPPDDLRPQFGRCIEVARALGVAAFVREGFEADDILATLTRRLGARQRPVEILTQDKDILQLVGPGVVVRTAHGERVDESAVRARFGVPPAQLTDYQALVGDRVDSIPGVPSVGPRTAQMLLKRFAGLDDLLAHLDRVPEVRLRQQLAMHAEQARLSLTLARLRDDVPLAVRLVDLRYRGPSDSAHRLFSELGLGRLLERAMRLTPSRVAGRDQRGGKPSRAPKRRPQRG